MIELSIGDTIKTSYGTGPFTITHVTSPRYYEEDFNCLLVRDYPVISLRCKDRGDTAEGRNYINNVRQIGARFFTDGDDEIFLLNRGVAPIVQMGLFDVAHHPQPYVFQPGVDYSTAYASGMSCPGLRLSFKHWQVFHCHRCSRDYNGQRINWVSHCPYCERWNAVGLPIVIFTAENNCL